LVNLIARCSSFIAENRPELDWIAIIIRHLLDLVPWISLWLSLNLFLTILYTKAFQSLYFLHSIYKVKDESLFTLITAQISIIIMVLARFSAIYCVGFIVCKSFYNVSIKLK